MKKVSLILALALVAPTCWLIGSAASLTENSIESRWFRKRWFGSRESLLHFRPVEHFPHRDYREILQWCWKWRRRIQRSSTRTDSDSIRVAPKSSSEFHFIFKIVFLSIINVVIIVTGHEEWRRFVRRADARHDGSSEVTGRFECDEQAFGIAGDAAEQGESRAVEFGGADRFVRHSVQFAALDCAQFDTFVVSVQKHELDHHRHHPHLARCRSVYRRKAAPSSSSLMTFVILLASSSNLIKMGDLSTQKTEKKKKRKNSYFAGAVQEQQKKKCL